MAKAFKSKRCRVCRKDFTPFRSTGVVCSITCAIAYSKTELQRAKRRQGADQRKAKREYLERSKTIGKRLQEAQAVFNAWIRERDKDQPCISCQSYIKGKENAGHYIPAGRGGATRFDEANVHKQCEPCNTHLSGNLVAYRRGLVVRIGIEEVERLEGPQPPVKWTHDQLKQIKAEYSRRLREAKHLSERQ